MLILLTLFKKQSSIYDFSDGDPASNSRKGFYVLNDEGRSVTETGGKAVWPPSGGAWAMADIRGLDQIPLTGDGIECSFELGEFRWTRLNDDPAAVSSEEYNVEIGIHSGALSQSNAEHFPHSFSNIRPSVYLDLTLNDDDDVQAKIVVKNGSGAGVHATGQHGARSQGFAISGWRGEGFRKFTIRLDSSGVTARCEGPAAVSNFLSWSDGGFNPPAPAALGPSVWLYFAGKNLWTGVGGHSLRAVRVTQL